MRPGFGRDFLIGGAGILGDPDAIWVCRSKRMGPRGKPRRDLGVADHARRERHLERQQIAAHSRVEHIAGIGQHLDRRRGLFKIGGRQPPAGAEFYVQVHLDVENGRETGCCFAHVSEAGRLVDGERVGAGKLDEEQVILDEVVTKRSLGKRTVCQPLREGVLGIGPPLGGCCCLQSLEETHDLSPTFRSKERLGALPCHMQASQAESNVR